MDDCGPGSVVDGGAAGVGAAPWFSNCRALDCISGDKVEEFRAPACSAWLSNSRVLFSISGDKVVEGAGIAVTALGSVVGAGAAGTAIGDGATGGAAASTEAVVCLSSSRALFSISGLNVRAPGVEASGRAAAGVVATDCEVWTGSTVVGGVLEL